MIKVAKFGGSSVANAEQFKKVKAIVESDISRKFIITSACGKEDKEDHKITDLLYLCHAHVKYGVSYDSIFSLIIDKYKRIKDSLHLTIDLDKEFDQMRSIISKEKDVDYLVSRGEYLTAKCLAEYLQIDFVDAQDVVAFNYDGTINMERTEEQLEPYCKEGNRIMLPGFYGSLPNGAIKVMSRGGSDITGAIVANIVNADVYENWTDVSGFLVADPRIIKEPKQIERITYNELREMSYMGANVLHDEAIFPVKRKNIPINIRNTNDPENPGTLIVENCEEQDKITPPHFITGITGKKDFTVVTVEKSHVSSEVGFLRRALQIFENYHVSIETVPVSVDSFSVVVESKAVETCIYEIIGEIKEQLKCDSVRLMDHLSLVAVVGRGMKEKPGISGKIFAEFGKNNINIKMINQGSDEINIIVGVENRDFEKTIQCIYKKFILDEEEV